MKETEEDTKVNVDSEAMEAKEKKDKVNSCFLFLYHLYIISIFFFPVN